MVQIQEHKMKIIEAQKELTKTENLYRRRDLFKYLMRLKKELQECEMHMNGTYGKVIK